MVMLARGFAGWAEAQRERRWLPRLAPSGATLDGKQVGVIGYGSVGRQLAVACKALGMRVWASRRTPVAVAGEPLDRWVPADELPELLAASDFVVVAAALNSTTRGLLGEAELRAMKRGALLVNVARGELIDHDALARALRDGRLGGAVLDVTDPEPLPAESPLWDAPNAWITPHVAGDTEKGWQRSIDLFCGNLRLYLEGMPERMDNLVDLAH
jgi:phosphoglycerate dehydrogenase-like enzyme